MSHAAAAGRASQHRLAILKNPRTTAIGTHVPSGKCPEHHPGMLSVPRLSFAQKDWSARLWAAGQPLRCVLFCSCCVPAFVPCRLMPPCTALPVVLPRS